ncbi:MAG TPA: hypothetical protein VHP11_04240 [Tepidisphaeraceae bacterium]|nr:hypothetical protein [Tepidisphaeraceae bacterium]
MTSRAPAAAEPVVVKPTPDIYTVLTAAAVVVVVFGLLVLWLRAGEVFGGLFSAPPSM